MNNLLSYDIFLLPWTGLFFTMGTAYFFILMKRHQGRTMTPSTEVQQVDERKFYDLFENASDAIFLFTLQADIPVRFMAVNQVACEQLGYTQHELLMKPPLDIIEESHQSTYVTRMKTIVERGTQAFFESSYLTKDGHMIPMEISVRVLTLDGKKLGFSIVRSIAERKEAEAQILQSEKLAIVGEFAASVAHEIRNPLTSIKGFLQLSANHQENPEYYSMMLAEVERIEAVVAQFLIIAKPQAVNRKPLHIPILVREVTEFLREHAMLSHVQIASSCDSDLPLVTGDEHQLKQVLINVLINAMDAMPGGGGISVQMRWHDEHRMAIRVVDQGRGIAKERLEKIAEPFFTTKEKGTGLGLTVSKRVLEAHHGQLLIRSKEGVGTTVDMVLPIQNIKDTEVGGNKVSS